MIQYYIVHACISCSYAQTCTLYGQRDPLNQDILQVPSIYYCNIMLILTRSLKCLRTNYLLPRIPKHFVIESLNDW